MAIRKGLIPTDVIPEKWWETPLANPAKLKSGDNKILLIVGDATGTLEDIKNFLNVCKYPFDTMCINYSVKLIPWPIQHFIAGDSHMADMQRIAAKLPAECLKHCWNPSSVGFNVRWIRNGRSGWNGTTANLGIKIGISLGYTRIVLAGCPMDNSGNWYAPLLPSEDVKQGKDHRNHLWKWAEIATRPIARLIRSMSGNTADLLGEPTEEWFDQAFNLKEWRNEGNKDQNQERVRSEIRTSGGTA